MGRLAQKEVHFKGGAVLPPGTPLGVPLWPLTHDKQLWTDPDVFDPWRHERMGQQEENQVDNFMTAARLDSILVSPSYQHTCD